MKIRVYAPNGDLIEDQRIGFGTGGYQWAWDGRDPNGHVLDEGSYRVVQELYDRFASRLRFTGAVELVHGTPPATPF